IVSRASSEFLIRLFEIEVPEIFDGIVEIKTVARIAGDRSKIAVISNDKRIDPVGACVGMKGIRIQSIVRELNNEKIDIIPWSDDPLIYIQRALSPAKPISTEIDEERKKATIIVSDEEYPLAIGKNGQNITLSNQLTGYEIEVLRESDEELKGDLLIDQVEGLTASTIAKLTAGGFERAEDILDAGIKGLKSVKGIGEKTAEKIISTIEVYFEEVE
ncbi:MAG: KH domain-containing protein, partial [Candidatus Marinimicrobia bacterium]|nr:KH domain-containing protein [Candidatus Neomarinimicrobiota bacterium]